MKTHVRVRNLTVILQERFGGVVARLARALNKSPNQVRLFLNPDIPSGRAIGERLARDIEGRLGLPSGCLDIEDETLYHAHICGDGKAAGFAGGAPSAQVNASRIAPKLYPLLAWNMVADWCNVLDKRASMSISEYFLCHKNLGDDGFVLRVEDDSMMAPGARVPFSRDMLLYVVKRETAEPGDYVVMTRDGAKMASLKRLTLVDGAEYFEALNPEWPHRFLRREPTDSILGVVVHAGYDLD